MKPGDKVAHPEHGTGIFIEHRDCGEAAVVFCADDGCDNVQLDDLELVQASPIVVAPEKPGLAYQILSRIPGDLIRPEVSQALSRSHLIGDRSGCKWPDALAAVSLLKTDRNNARETIDRALKQCRVEMEPWDETENDENPSEAAMAAARIFGILGGQL